MTEDGPSVPKTPLSNKRAPPPDPFHDAAKTLAQRAATLFGRRPVQAQVVLFQSLVSEMPTRAASDPPDATTLPELFAAAFGDASGREFWRLRLQPPIGPSQFAEMLATFLAIEGGEKPVHRSAIGEELVRDLTTAGQVPPMRSVADAPLVDYVDPTDGQRRTYTMPPVLRFVGDDFFPEKPLRWMAEREWYRNRLPASLIAYLTYEPVKEAGATLPQLPPRSGAPGRPTSKHLALAEMAERAKRGETLLTCKAEAEWLSAWVSREHSGMPEIKAHTLETVIAAEYRKIRNPIRK